MILKQNNKKRGPEISRFFFFRTIVRTRTLTVAAMETGQRDAIVFQRIHQDQTGHDIDNQRDHGRFHRPLGILQGIEKETKTRRTEKAHSPRA